MQTRQEKLREVKQQLRWWARTQLGDERLAEVYAFNADGKMSYDDPCGCVRGVMLATTLHHSDEFGRCLTESSGNRRHYRSAGLVRGMYEVENAYQQLGFYVAGRWPSEDEREQMRRVRLGPILKAEMRRRARAREKAVEREVALLKAAAPGMCRMERGDLVALAEVAEG